jgi:hypothetical protein
MSKWPMRGHFRYLRFKTFSMTPKTPQWEVFWALLSSSEHSRVPKGSKPPTFPSVGLHPHTWPKWGCDSWCDYISKENRHLIFWNNLTYKLMRLQLRQSVMPPTTFHIQWKNCTHLYNRLFICLLALPIGKRLTLL